MKLFYDDDAGKPVFFSVVERLDSHKMLMEIMLGMCPELAQTQWQVGEIF